MTLNYKSDSFVLLSIVLMMIPLVSWAASIGDCNGPNESLVAVGGGCYVNEKGESHCASPQPPKCVCVSGFERNPTNKKCEAPKQDCTGPNESLVQVGGGCFRTADGKSTCLPAKAPECVCNSGFERNPVNKLCEAVAITKKKN